MTDDREAIARRIATSVQERIDQDSSSRRGFLGRSVLAGGTLLALSSGAGLALAGDEETEEMDSEAPAETGAAFDDVEGTDVDVLNYALALEHLEDAFYREGFETFDEDDFVEADALERYDEDVRAGVFAYLESIGEHESAHVEVLTRAVELLGGDPAQAAEYDFGIESVEDFLALGQVLENTGVAAYAGAAPFVESPDLLSAALSIHSVEARHAALLNELNGDSPLPDAFDSASSQQEVLDAVSQFIVTEMDDGDDEEMDNGMNETTAENGD